VGLASANIIENCMADLTIADCPSIVAAAEPINLRTTPAIDSSNDSANLITQIAAGNQLALSELYSRYARIVYAIAFHSLQSAEESEEAVLDVFAQIWQIADRYDPAKGRADIWLLMLTRSCVSDRWRNLQSRTGAAGRILDIASKPQLPSSRLEL
jgi:DNA-directed RNA polymerase specialized sigma24 family protein